jgi:hypothetical protein
VGLVGVALVVGAYAASRGIDLAAEDRHGDEQNRLLREILREEKTRRPHLNFRR